MYTNIIIQDVIFSLSTKEVIGIKNCSLDRKLFLCRNVKRFANKSKQTGFAITEPTFLRFWDQLNAMVELRYDDYVGRSHLHCVMAFQVVDENLPTVWSVLCPANTFFAEYLLELCQIVEAKLQECAIEVAQVSVLLRRLPSPK